MDIEQRPKVNLGYAAPDSGRYVSVSGTGRILHNPDKARELWRPEFQAWFPDGPDDGNLAVLEIEIASADYWETPVGPGEQVYAANSATTSPPMGDQTHLEFSSSTQERSQP